MKAALAAARTGEPTAGFTWAVPVADVLEQKRAAIAAHASQVTRFRDDPRWESLLDEGGGEFLERFLTVVRAVPAARRKTEDGRRTRPPEGGKGPAAAGGVTANGRRQTADGSQSKSAPSPGGKERVKPNRASFPSPRRGKGPLRSSG